MNVARRYYACRSCKRTYAPWDDWAGVADGAQQMSEHARKVIVTVATAWSFETAAAVYLTCGRASRVRRRGRSTALS